jgi:hypothetical protein
VKVPQTFEVFLSSLEGGPLISASARIDRASEHDSILPQIFCSGKKK